MEHSASPQPWKGALPAQHPELELSQYDNRCRRAIAMFEAASALGAETLNWHYVDVSSPNPTVDSMVFVGKE